MKQLIYWTTPYARHVVPESIVWLAEKAEFLSTGAHMWRCADIQSVGFFPWLKDTAYFKVIEEWGKWREEKDKVEYEAARMEAA